MYDTITFEQFVTYYSKLYIQEYGADKIQKIAAKVKSSNSLNRFINELFLLRKPCTIDLIVYAINRIFFFIFSSNKTQAIASLFTLCQWQDKVNLKLMILDDDDLKEIAVGIVEKLGASYPDMEFQFIKFKMIDHGMELLLGKQASDQLYKLDNQAKENPLIDFFQWLLSKEFEEEQMSLSDLILRYIPGLSFRSVGNENLDNRKALITICKKESLPFNMIGLCMFIHTIISRRMIRIDDNPIFFTGSDPTVHQKMVPYRKSWEDLVNRNFNLDYFEEYIDWVLEEDYLGEENTRIKNIWN